MGDFGSSLMYSEWYPENESKWVNEALALEDFSWLVGDPIELREITEYWKGKCQHDITFSLLDAEEEKRIREGTEKGAQVCNFFTEIQIGKGWYGINYEKAIKKGLLGEKIGTLVSDDKR